MLINATAAEEIRMAVVEDGILTDLDVETQTREKSKGNIYKGIVANVEASLNAAFIEFGHAKQGFLAFDDLRPELWDPAYKGDGKPRISDVLKRGQHLIIQVVKEEMGSKGAAVTSYLSLPGRYVVLMHSGGGRGGVSRKIDDERERQKAKDALDRLKVPDGLGVIVRTAGIGKSRAELQKDLNAVARQWQKVSEASDIARPPSLLHREPDLVVRTIRDYLAPDVDEVWVDDPDEFEEAVDYFSGGEDATEEEAETGRSQELIKVYEGTVPLFERYGVEDQIEVLYKRTVPLPSGGYLVIDQTEALVAIDVNSGKSNREGDHESTVYKTNLEAVTEAARQLRLRDMGGIIVVDLIDMASRKHDRDVEQRFKEAIKSDRARIKVGRISENGLLELTRQRLRAAHRLVSHVPCPTCTGTGVIRAIPGQAVAALRELQTRAAASHGALSRLAVRLPTEVANFLQNNKRRELDALAQQYDLKIEVLADATLGHGESKPEEERRGRAALAAPAVPQVKEDDWRQRRRFRGGEEKPRTEALSIEERQEQRFNEDRGRASRDRRWDRGGRGDRPERGERGRKPDRSRGEPAAEPAPPAVAAPPRHYPDDALMEALFGDPPELVVEAPQPKAAGRSKTAPPKAAAVAAEAAAPDDAAEPAAQPGEAAEGGEALVEGDGVRKKRRRRRRRRRGGAEATNGTAGQATNGATHGEGADGDDGDDDDVEPQQLDLMQAATAAILGDAAGLPAIPLGVRGNHREVPEAADVLAAMEQASQAREPHAPAASWDLPTGGMVPSSLDDDDADEDGADDDTDDVQDSTNGEREDALPPLPPAEAGGEEPVAVSSEAPTVAAKRTTRKPAARKSKAAPRGKKKPAARAKKKA